MERHLPPGVHQRNPRPQLPSRHRHQHLGRHAGHTTARTRTPLLPQTIHQHPETLNRSQGHLPRGQHTTTQKRLSTLSGGQPNTDTVQQPHRQLPTRIQRRHRDTRQIVISDSALQPAQKLGEAPDPSTPQSPTGVRTQGVPDTVQHRPTRPSTPVIARRAIRMVPVVRLRVNRRGRRSSCIGVDVLSRRVGSARRRDRRVRSDASL
ncbi:hypothetical protein STPH1_7225 [Streptomyces sp. OM5714]|nr:hypothetical protein STPH1_7225 [Streptomyces sp. OM5714]